MAKIVHKCVEYDVIAIKIDMPGAAIGSMGSSEFHL